MANERGCFTTQLQRVLDLIKGGDHKVCFQASGTCLAGAGIDDGDSVYIDFDHYPRAPLYRSRGDCEDRIDVCMCFARYPGAKEPALMLKQYLGVSFMAQTVGTCYKDRTNCAFGAMAILGVVYAVFDPKGNLKWARDPEEFDEELTTKGTMKYVDIEPCSSLCLSK